MTKRQQPDRCFEAHCPLAGVAHGFCLGAGVPKTALITTILEAPGKDEIAFTIKPSDQRSFLRTKQECDEEIERRRKAYPDLPEEFLTRGVPIVGRTGSVTMQWILPKSGLTREQMFIDNTIRCLAPKNKQGQNYPIGDTRKQAEYHCRMWDRVEEFRPKSLVMSLHPAALMREVTPLSLVVEDFKKTRDFVTQDARPVLLLGGKSAHVFAGFGENITKHRGAYVALAEDWREKLLERLRRRAETKKKKREKPDVLEPQVKKEKKVKITKTITGGRKKAAKQLKVKIEYSNIASEEDINEIVLNGMIEEIVKAVFSPHFYENEIKIK